MSEDPEPPRGRNRTVFRPSPLSGIKPAHPGQPGPPQQAPPARWGAPPPPQTAPPPPPPSPPVNWGAPEAFGTSPPPPPPVFHAAPPAFSPAPVFAPPPPAYSPPPPVYSVEPQPTARLSDDDIPLPATPRKVRSLLNEEASQVLALASSVRSGRAQLAMPEFHRLASEAIARYDRTIAGTYPEETRMRARYVLCATVDDIAQNLPNIGHDGAEWARRSLVVQFFRENIGGDRFWQLVEDMLARPQQNTELIELFHACLAAGFEGRFRVMPDGKRRLHEVMGQLYGALEHPRSLSMLDISPRWKGLLAPLRKISPLSQIALAAVAAALLLLGVYAMLRLVLMSSGADSWTGIRGLTAQAPLRLSRVGAPPPKAQDSTQLSRLRQFLAPEIAEKLVTVEEDASTVRVRTTVGQLFQSGSDRLESGREALFTRIGQAIEAEKGPVTIEGHADSDKVASLAFPDNLALSKARADTVAGIIGNVLSDPARISAKGFGDNQPLASNDTDEGKSKNRRVEIVVPRQQ